MTTRSSRVTVRIDPKRNEEVDVQRTGRGGEHDPEGEPRIEEERERLIAHGLSPGAQPFDADRAGNGRNERGQDRGDAEQVAGGNSGERGVPDSVPDEAHVPLHQKEPHGRRQEADDGPRGEREAHELTRACPCEGSCHWEGRVAGGPSKTMPPRTRTSRSTISSTAPNSWETYSVVTRRSR